MIKPATPRTSSTRTVTARLPSSMVVDNDADRPGPVTRDARMGSFFARVVRAARRPSLSRSCLVLNAPSGMSREPQEISLRLSSDNVVPKGTACEATTTVPPLVDACEWLSSQLRARNAAMPPNAMATKRMTKLFGRIVLTPYRWR